jgi:hypothetical protein
VASFGRTAARALEGGASGLELHAHESLWKRPPIRVGAWVVSCGETSRYRGQESTAAYVCTLARQLMTTQRGNERRAQ